MNKFYYSNELSNQNKTARSNIVWVCDFTTLELEENKKIYIYILLDIHTNTVLGFLVSTNTITSRAVVKLLKRIISERFPIPPKVKLILHSDRGTQFSSKNFNDFINKFSDFILPSMSRENTPTDNSVAERFMRTLKGHKINSKTLQEYIFDELISGKVFKSYRPMVAKYISSLNESPNKKSFNKAPQHHDLEVSVASVFMQDPKHTKAFSGHIIADPRAKIIDKYKSDNQNVVKALEKIVNENSEIVTDTPFDSYEANLNVNLVRQAFKEINTALKNNPKKVSDQVEQLLNPMQDSIDGQFDEVNKKLDQLLPKDRRRREVLPLRDPLNIEIFPLFLLHAGDSFKYQKDLKRAQLRITYTILFHVGLRINEIRNLNQHDILTAIKASQFQIIHTKTQTASNHVLSKKALNDLKNCQLEFEIIFNKYRYKYLFGKTEPIVGKNLIRMVNRDLKNTCKLEDIPFNIKSHSFRINMITNFLKITTVQHAAEIIGHDDIRSTLMYNRHLLSVKYRIF